MKTYTIEITIEEGSDEFWESLNGKSGCDEVVDIVRDALADVGFTEGYGTAITLTGYTNKE
jgi:hypothetical protein